jgi:integrase
VSRKAHHAALSWLARHALPDATPLANMTDIRDLVTEEHVNRALRAYVERANASAVLKNANETSSLTTWLSNLATLARRGLGDDDLGWDIDDKKFEEDVETYADREMSASRAAFVRLIDYDPSVARTIVLAPQTLHAEAMRGLASWDELGTNARIEVLHMLMAAAMWALQIGRPLRTKNLNELTHQGSSPQINTPRSGEADPFMFITRSKVKNRRDIEGRIHPAYWKIVDDWIKLGRTKYIEIHKDRGFVDGEYLFPGAKGALSRHAFNKVWNRSVRLLGIPGLTPHMMRHVVATLHLAVHPGDYAVVAALLCDSIRTVEKFYARGEGRGAADLFIATLAQLHPEVAALIKKAA